MSAPRLTAIVAHHDMALCDSVARLLSQVEGWRVYNVSNGGDAVRVALATLPHVVLLDPDLQGMTGIATIASLRAHGIKCPVVALVQHSDYACEHWAAQGYVGAVALSTGLARLVPQLQALLDSAA